MKRLFRVSKIWFNGKLSLAEKIHIRIWREELYLKIINSINLSQDGHVDSKAFMKIMNEAQLNYFNKLATK